MKLYVIEFRESGGKWRPASLQKSLNFRSVMECANRLGKDADGRANYRVKRVKTKDEAEKIKQHPRLTITTSIEEVTEWVS